MFNPADIPASKKEFMAAVDRQFPPKTDAERAAYYARRRFLADLESRRRWDKAFRFIDRTLDLTVLPLLAVLIAATCYLVWATL